MAEKEITIEIKNPEVLLLLAILFGFLVLYLQTTLSTPIVFGDEGYHTRIAQEIAKQVEFFVEMPFEGTKILQHFFARPPLWNILEASFLVFGYNEVIIKVLTPFIASILVGISMFVLLSRIYNKEVGIFAAILTVALPSFATYAVLFYTDILFTWYFSLSILFLVYAMQTEGKKYFVLSGIFGAFSILTKTPGLFIIPIFGLCFLYQVFAKRSFFKPLKDFLILVLFLIIASSGFFVRNLYYFGTPFCGLPFFPSEKCSGSFNYTPKYQYAGRVEQVGTEASVFSPVIGGLMGYLDFAYGNNSICFENNCLYIPFFLLVSLCGLVLFLYRRERNDIAMLLALSLFIPLFYSSTGRAEDTARYTLGFAPIIAILAGNYLKSVVDFGKNYIKQSYAVFALVLVIALFFSYQNVCGLSLGCNAGKLGAMKTVKQFLPLFFEACDWIKQNVREDAVIWTVWGHRMVYSCQRTNAGNGPDTPDIVLSNDLGLVLSRLKANGITHIFVQKFSIDLYDQHLAEKYDSSFVQFLEDNPEHFKVVYENGVNMNITNRNVKSYLQYCIQQFGYICDGNLLYEVVGV